MHGITINKVRDEFAPFNCEYCGKGQSRKDSLNRHYKVCKVRNLAIDAIVPPSIDPIPQQDMLIDKRDQVVGNSLEQLEEEVKEVKKDIIEVDGQPNPTPILNREVPRPIRPIPKAGQLDLKRYSAFKPFIER